MIKRGYALIKRLKSEVYEFAKKERKYVVTVEQHYTIIKW